MAVILLLAMAGCSGAGQNTTEGKDPGNGKDKLMIWSYYETREQQESLDMLVELFNSSQGTYEAGWEYHGPVMEFNKQMALAMTEKQMPDLVIMDQADMQNYIHKGLLEDITSYILETGEEEEYYPASMQSVKQEDRYYGLPFCCNTAALIYNKERLAEAGLEAPETISEFLMTAKSISDEENYGFAMSAVSGSQSSFQILPWILSAGEELSELGGIGTEETFGLILELVQSGSMPKECINWSPNDVARGFMAGQYAMMENSLDVVPSLEENGMEIGIVKLPLGAGRKSVAGGESIGIIRGKNRSGALALLDFYRQEDVMEAICGPWFGLAPKIALAARQAHSHPRYRVYEEELENSISPSSYTKWPGLSETLSGMLTQVILEQRTPAEAAQKLMEESK